MSTEKALLFSLELTSKFVVIRKKQIYGNFKIKTYSGNW